METSSEGENLSSKSDGEGGELNSNVQCLLERIEKLETEKQQIREEFGYQRAKMKELYLQKEEELKRVAADQSKLLADVEKLTSELNEVKSQLAVAGFRLENDLQDEKRKCQEEIASLQQIVRETFEESSSCHSKYESEVKQLRQAYEGLKLENRELQSQLQQQQATADKGEKETPILATGVMLSAVTKSLARKVVSQLGADASSTSQDNLEDSMRKVNKYAQEDAEVLRSLVIPLEEEIDALKEKLRYTDQQLRKYEGDKDEIVKWTEEVGNVSVKEAVSVDPQNGSCGDVVSPSRDDGIRVQTSSLDMDVHQSPVTPSTPKISVMSTAVTPTSSQNEHQAGSMKKQSSDCHSPVPEDSRSLTDVTSEKDPESVGSPVSQGHPAGCVRLQPATSPCDMCCNYETQLVRAQQRGRELEKQVASLERTVERYREDLAKESDFRKDMEEKWNEKKEEHKMQVAELNKKMDTAEKALQELRQSYTQVQSEVKIHLASLTQEREQVQAELSKLQEENDNLLGKRSAHSQKLQDEMINWPEKVEDLHVLLLKFHEELITAKVAKEFMEEQEKTLRCEIQLIQEQMSEEQTEKMRMQSSLTQELHNLKIQLHTCQNEHRKYKATHNELEELVKNSQKTATEFEAKLTDALIVKKQLEEQVVNLKSRVVSLQQELGNSEAVQKDFVRLSQSLQVELERFRAANTEVRWQHEEDVEACQGCRSGFSFARSKQHCRHCGRIFCISCLSHTVHSGPNQRPSKVCDVCHTLLVPDTAPYFSTEPPHSPD